MQNRRRAMRGIFILTNMPIRMCLSLIQQLLTTTNSEVILTFNFDSLQGFYQKSLPTEKHWRK